MPLRLVLLVRSLGVGGAERQAALTACELARRGCEITVVTFYGGGAFEGDLAARGITVEAIGKRSRWDLAGPAVRLIRLLRRLQPHAIYSYTPTPNIAAALVRPLVGQCALIWGVRASDMKLEAYGLVPRLMFRVHRLFSGAADAIVSNSESGRSYHVESGFPADKFDVIANGIDVDRFRPDESGRALRAGFGAPAGSPLIGIVARLDPMKDHRCFIRAAALLQQERPDVRFVCVGDGPAAYREGLLALARELGVDRNIHWAGVRADLSAVYSALTVATSTSLTEGFSNSVAEAMACGVPVVATDVGDSRVIVGDTGIVVPPADPHALKCAWSQLLASDSAALGARARQRIVDRFSPATMAARTEQLIAAQVSRLIRSSTTVQAPNEN